MVSYDAHDIKPMPPTEVLSFMDGHWICVLRGDKRERSYIAMMLTSSQGTIVVATKHKIKNIQQLSIVRDWLYT